MQADSPGSWPLVIAGVLVGMIGVVIAGGILVASWFSAGVADPEDVAVAARLPLTAGKGETVSLVLEVYNHRRSTPFHMTRVEMEDSLLSGFQLQSVEPEPIHVDATGGWSTVFDFDVSVPPGQTFQLTLVLRAVESGVYRGDVDIYEYGNFLTTSAQVAILDGK